MPEVTVVLVNYRCEDHTVACLDHLAGLDGEVPEQMVVVDNSPSEGLAAAIGHHGPAVVYLPQPANLGFAGGVNRGLEAARGRFVVLLNPDARPEPGCLSGLVGVLTEVPNAAAGPAMVAVAQDRECPPSALRRDPDLWTALVEYTVAHRLVGRDWLDRRYFLRARDVTSSPVECATVQGACLAVPRAVLERLGGLDAERFFLYWEETDLLRRLRAGGGKVLYCPHLRCAHHGGASVAGGAQDHRHFWRGLYAYHRKHHGLLYELLLRGLLAPGMAAELALLGCLHAVRRGRDPVLQQDVATYRARLREQVRVRPLRRWTGVR